MTDTIVFNDVEYTVDDLSERAQHLVAQLKDVDSQVKALNSRLEQMQLANQGFTQLLQQELQNFPEEFIAE